MADGSDPKAPSGDYSKEDTYFANLTEDKIGNCLMERVAEHFRYIDSTGQVERMDKSYRCWYGQPFNSVTGNSSEITADGDEDEYAKIRVNHYRNIGQHQLGLITAETPAPKPVAKNSDHKTIGDVLAAQGYLDHFRRKLDMDKRFFDAVEYCIMLSEGYVKSEWDPDVGPIMQTLVDPTTGLPKQVRTGAPKCKALSPADVIKDPHLQGQADNKWYITVEWVNRYDLMAKKPDKAEQIKKISVRNDNFDKFRFIPAYEDNDLVPVYEFLHEKTPAVPNGRRVVLLDHDCVLIYEDLPYDDVPIRRIAPGELRGTSHGWTVMFDLLCIQEAIDQLYSIVLTNQKTFGHQNILIPEGSNISLSQMKGGLNFIKYFPQLGGIKPEALQLTYTPKEIFEFIKQLEAIMETLSGVNQVVRGGVPKQLESGSSLAIVQAQVQTFLKTLMQEFVRLVQDVYTDQLKIFQRYGKYQQKVVIAGKSKNYTVRELSKDDVSMVETVMVEAVNPLSNTVAGKKEQADALLGAGLLTAQQYVIFNRTGNLEMASERDEKESQYIRQENEIIASGAEPPDPMMTDNHLRHLQEHQVEMFNPDIRLRNPQTLMAGTQHMQKHIMLLATADPIQQNLLMLLGQQPLAMPMAPPGEEKGGPNSKGSQPAPKGAPPTAGAEPDQPKQPVNPQTGQTWDAGTGGGVISPPTSG
jgi:hypothetical protein